MPARNKVKPYVPNSYYHIYNRGVEKRDIYRDEDDYRVFLNLLKRSLDREVTTDLKGREYANYYGEIELLAYCLMPNHFHLFIYQTDEKAITKLLRSVAIPYGMYFNEKYRRVGPVSQDRFKAVLISADNQLLHITRYIHLNPIDIKTFPKTFPGSDPGNVGSKGQKKSNGNYMEYPYSSLKYYLGKANAGWVRPKRILDIFADERIDYQEFLADWEDYREVLKRGALEVAG